MASDARRRDLRDGESDLAIDAGSQSTLLIPVVNPPPATGIATFPQPNLPPTPHASSVRPPLSSAPLDLPVSSARRCHGLQAEGVACDGDATVRHHGRGHRGPSFFPPQSAVLQPAQVLGMEVEEDAAQGLPVVKHKKKPSTKKFTSPMEGLRLSKAKLTVYVHPSNANDVRGAVARQLSSLLFTYEERFDGVLLGHKFEVVGQKDNIKDKVKAKILNGLVPYFGVPVHATLLMFSPQPGMILEGKVEMLGKESIHAVVLGVFSVAIMSDDIHEKFKFRRKGDGGRFISRSDKQHVIKRGSMIRFSVKRVDIEMNCHITGSLIPPHTGSRQWLSEHDDEYASEINRYVAENSSSKRRSRDINIKVEQDDQENGKLNNINGVMNYERSRKSRKRSLEE